MYSSAHHLRLHISIQLGECVVCQVPPQPRLQLRTTPTARPGDCPLAVSAACPLHWLISAGWFSTALTLKPEFVEARCNMVDLLGGTVQWATWQQQRRQLTNRVVGELHEEDSRSPIPMPRGLRCVVQCVLVLTAWLPVARLISLLSCSWL